MVTFEIFTFYVLFWGFFASICFTALLVIMYLTGTGNLVRDEKGKFKEKEKISAGGYLLFFLFLGLVIGLPIIANLFFVVQEGVKLNIIEIFILTYGIFLFVNLWDLIIIDYFLVVKNVFQLKNLPQTPYYTTFRPHLNGFLRGLIFGLVFSVISSIIAFLIIG
ncbi:MAG: hypothetical protein ACFFE8_06615 [Candidatus Heimdallarchaeota archaeon]